MSFLASADSSLILPKSPAFTRSPFTIQLPPQQRILSQERYSVKFPRFYHELFEVPIIFL